MGFTESSHTTHTLLSPSLTISLTRTHHTIAHSLTHTSPSPALSPTHTRTPPHPWEMVSWKRILQNYWEEIWMNCVNLSTVSQSAPTSFNQDAVWDVNMPGGEFTDWTHTVLFIQIPLITIIKILSAPSTPIPKTTCNNHSSS